MPRPAARNQEHHIEAHLVFLIARVTRQPKVGRAPDPLGLLAGDGGLGIFDRQAPLYFDEGDAPTPRGNEIDLACARFHPSPEDAIALRQQERGRQSLRDATPP